MDSTYQIDDTQVPSTSGSKEKQQQVRSVTSTFPEQKLSKLIELSDDEDYVRMNNDGAHYSMTIPINPIDYSMKNVDDYIRVKDFVVQSDKSEDSGVDSPCNIVDGGVNYGGDVFISDNSDAVSYRESDSESDDEDVPRRGNLVEQSLDEFITHVNKYWHCKVDSCSYATQCKPKLRRHLLSHTALKPFHCTWTGCGYACKRRSYVYQHVRVVHFHLPSTVEEANRCGIVCDGDPKQYLRVMPFDLVEALRNRSTELVQNGEKRVREPKRREVGSYSKMKILGLNCLECSELLPNKDQLDYHLARMHQKSGFYCLVRDCGASFYFKHQLLAHHHTEWACNVAGCTHKALNRTKLLSHFNCCHQKGRYLCGLCSEEFDLKIKVHKHVSRKCKWSNYSR